MHENQDNVTLEIGHVLFLDIVGYSKLPINEQTELIEHLKEMVRGSAQAERAHAEGKLIRLATGDDNMDAKLSQFVGCSAANPARPSGSNHSSVRLAKSFILSRTDYSGEVAIF
ncbi:MAG TPA: hypothetical protein VGM65_01465 [Candidatus Udaeobacter sp.]|jgi:hypothetical protein